MKVLGHEFILHPGFNNNLEYWECKECNMLIYRNSNNECIIAWGQHFTSSFNHKLDITCADAIIQEIIE